MAHTAHAIDFEALRGKTVAVLGAAASSFDAAAVALEAGAAAVHLFARRDHITATSVARTKAYPGVYDNYHALPDATRRHQAVRYRRPGSTPPADSVQRVLQFPNSHLHPNAAWTAAQVEAGRIYTQLNGEDFYVDFSIAGTGETLLKALTILAAASKSPVVLIIDEAQHTQTTEEGRQALYGLKAARDALNASTGPGFRLLATGSNSDKLASLVEEKDQAFYQAPLLALPMLGNDYLAWVRERLRFQPAPSMAALERTFTACNHRPEPLRNVLRSLSLAVESEANKVDALLEQLMAESLAQSKANFLQQVNGLPPLDAAVLKVMAQTGKSFAPYTKAAYTAYSAFMLASTGEMPADVGQSPVQMALERLRGEKFIWRAGRGAYLIEDSQHIALLNEVIAQEKSEVEQARQALLARTLPNGTHTTPQGAAAAP